MPSPSSSETQSTVVVKPSTVRTGVLLVVINSLIWDFCNRRIATSTRTACDNAGIDVERAIFLQNRRRGCQRAGGLGQVIHQEHVAALHFADDIERFRLGRALPLLGHDREVRAERLRVGATPFSIRRRPAKRPPSSASSSRADT